MIPFELPLLAILAVMSVDYLIPISAASTLPSETPTSTLTVTKLDDTNDGNCNADCSLREAIAAADPNDLISFSSGLAGTITLDSTLVVSKNLTIKGPDKNVILISGNNAVRIFYVNAGVHFTIKNLSISGGSVKAVNGSPDTLGRAGGDARGGALYSDGGIVTIINSTFSDNGVTGGAGGGDGRWGGQGMGGAVFSTGALVMLNSTFSHNQAKGGPGSPSIMQPSGSPGGEGMGGAIFSTGTLVTVNSTLSGNKAIGEKTAIGSARSGLWGGRILFGDGYSYGYGGAIFTTSEVWMSNCTLVDNTASKGSAIYRLGALPFKNKLVINPSGAITIKNTLIADNSFGGNCDASIISEGYNIDSDGTCGLQAAGDLTGINPKLETLKDNGGATLTHALLPGSPAIDSGNPAGCTDHKGKAILTDQRGRIRPWGDQCDIGAFEFSR